MKKTILAMAVPALLAAGAANASINLYSQDGVTVDLSGAMEIQYYKDKAQNEDGKLRVDDADLMVTTGVELTDTLAAIGGMGFKYEGSDEGIVEDTAAVSSDELWVGLSSSEFGALTFGRQLLISDDAGNTLDYEAGNGWGTKQTSGTQVIKYVYDNGMFYAGASVNLDQHTADDAEYAQIWDGRVGVRVAGLDARVYYYSGENFGDYEFNDTTEKFVFSGLYDQKAWNLEADYVIGDFLIAAAYGQIEDKPVAGGDKVETDVFSIGLGYALNDKVDFAVGYDWAKEKEGATKVDSDNVYANVTYGFHSNVKAYAEVGFYDDNKAGTDYDTLYLVGMEVKF